MNLLGLPNIDKLKVKKNINGLIKALGYEKNATVRAKAAVALGEIGDKKSVEPLIAMLNDSDVDVQEAVIIACKTAGGNNCIS